MEVDNNTCWFVEPLLQWWVDTNPRRYPWRDAHNIYHALIAELLLLRTRRDVVSRIYGEFLKLFPRPTDLARANEEEVKRILRPLGLSKRSKYIIETARILEKKPIRSYQDLIDLPGVGEYIASIVSSTHLGERRVAVDKNVARIIIRLFDIKPKNPARPQDDPSIHRIVRKCAPGDRFREYTLALIDLGWEICKPRNPLCNRCPLKFGCSFYQHQSKSPKNFDRHSS